MKFIIFILISVSSTVLMMAQNNETKALAGHLNENIIIEQDLIGKELFVNSYDLSDKEINSLTLYIDYMKTVIKEIYKNPKIAKRCLGEAKINLKVFKAVLTKIFYVRLSEYMDELEVYFNNENGNDIEKKASNVTYAEIIKLRQKKAINVIENYLWEYNHNKKR